MLWLFSLLILCVGEWLLFRIWLLVWFSVLVSIFVLVLLVLLLMNFSEVCNVRNLFSEF